MVITDATLRHKLEIEIFTSTRSGSCRYAQRDRRDPRALNGYDVKVFRPDPAPLPNTSRISAGCLLRKPGAAQELLPYPQGGASSARSRARKPGSPASAASSRPRAAD